jgi:hypothetical protein
MGLPRSERMTPSDLLKHTKEAYDRLQEISPLIPPDIIKVYKKEFEKYKDITLPEEMNGLTKITIVSDKKSLTIRNPLSSVSLDSSKTPAERNQSPTPSTIIS